jgi:hypothetical protein
VIPFRVKKYTLLQQFVMQIAPTTSKTIYLFQILALIVCRDIFLSEQLVHPLLVVASQIHKEEGKEKQYYGKRIFVHCQYNLG